MKPSLAHLSPTLPAALATGAAVTLSVFLLAGAEPQGEPAPLLPALGGAAVHVIADLPVTRPHASKAAPTPITSTELATTSAQQLALHRNTAVSRAHRPTHHGRARVHRAAPAPVQIAPPAAPAPVVTRHTFRAPPGARGKARGRSHSHAGGGGPAAAAHARGHGHGNAAGHTHRGAPPGQAKKAPNAPHPVHAAPTKAPGGGPPPGHGGGNGHGGKK